MKARTKVIIAILATFLMMATGVFYFIAREYSGKTYYTQIINAGVAAGSQYDEEDSIEYVYNEPAFDKDGNELEITFSSFRERALRANAYLSVVYNEKNGVISYCEVQREEIPQKALEGLDKYAD